MSKLTIVDLHQEEELSSSNMGKVAGGAVVCISEPATGGSWCETFDQYFKEAALQGGPGGVIAAAAALKV
ncbi:MAG TPA: hypothetical protein VEK10_12415 [Steroidobacteraceae bacterium]|nr:hypothetical protein [Steroidobacteraceae bacterium]